MPPHCSTPPHPSTAPHHHQVVEDIFATLSEKWETMEHVNLKALCLPCKGVIVTPRLPFLPFEVLKWPLFCEIIFDKLKSW